MNAITLLLIYIILSIFSGIKQYHCAKELTFLACILSPIWIIVAFIKQFIIRDWE